MSAADGKEMGRRSRFDWRAAYRHAEGDSRHDREVVDQVGALARAALQGRVGVIILGGWRDDGDHGRADDINDHGNGDNVEDDEEGAQGVDHPWRPMERVTEGGVQVPAKLGLSGGRTDDHPRFAHANARRDGISRGGHRGKVHVLKIVHHKGCKIAHFGLGIAPRQVRYNEKLGRRAAVVGRNVAALVRDVSEVDLAMVDGPGVHGALDCVAKVRAAQKGLPEKRRKSNAARR